jgi:peptide/nickel transport system permease protein
MNGTPTQFTTRWMTGPLHRVATAFLAALGFVAAVFAIFHLAHIPYPADPAATDLAGKLLSPNSRHWFGTDALGRDVLTRLLHGSYISLAVGFVAVAVELALGVTVGAAAGYFRGTVDAVLMRFVGRSDVLPGLFSRAHCSGIDRSKYSQCNARDWSGRVDAHRSVGPRRVSDFT